MSAILRTIVLLLFAVLLSVAGTGAPQAPSTAQAAPAAYSAQPGPLAVEVARYDWGDARRERDVPAKLYYPAAEKGPFPVIIFSHGAGGSREGYEYLGRHWASYGYVSVHLQHEGSDEAVWRGRTDPLEGIRESAADLRNALARPPDVSFAIDQVERLNRDEGPLRGRLDLARIGVAGHSFGAWTTLAVAGQTFVLPAGRELSLRDARVKAAIPMSAPVPARRETHAKAFGSIAIPCLHMTGTLDSSLVSDTTPEQRRIPYDNIGKADQYLVTFIGGDHMVFSGRLPPTPPEQDRLRRPEGGAKDAAFQDLIKAGTTAFWDAYLKEDPAAKEWLAGGGYERLLGKEASFEKVLAAAR